MKATSTNAPLINLKDVMMSEGPFEVNREVVYDWLPFDLMMGTRELQFFCRNMAQAPRGYTDTNMDMANCFYHGFIMDYLWLQVRGAATHWMTIQQLRDLMLYSVVEVRYLDKLMGKYPPEIATHGVYFDPPLVLGPHMTFRVDQRWTEHRFPKLHERDLRSNDFEIGAVLSGWRIRHTM